MANPGHANDYTDLYFGEADAKTEASKEPESFIRSFVDPDGAIDAILHNGRFLALGPQRIRKKCHRLLPSDDCI